MQLTKREELILDYVRRGRRAFTENREAYSGWLRSNAPVIDQRMIAKDAMALFKRYLEFNEDKI